MKVAMYYNNKDVRIEEMPTPNINDDEILVKVISSGICGTDVMEWYRIKKAPLVLGHEIAGIIDKIGKNIKNFKTGDRVMVSHHVPCMQCRYCNTGHHTACETIHKTNIFPGGFSEFIRVPSINVKFGALNLPDEVSFDEGTFIEPLGCAIRGQKALQIKNDDSLLVFGAGISGLIHIKLAKSRGIKKIIAADINEQRLDYARKFGATDAINAKEDVASKLKEKNIGRLADKVMLCTGSMQAANTAMKCIDKGGTLLFFAVPKPDEKLDIPINDFWKNDVRIITSYGASPFDLKEALQLIRDKKISFDDMITHKLGMDQVQEGFQLVAEAKDSIKVIIEPNK